MNAKCRLLGGNLCKIHWIFGNDINKSCLVFYARYIINHDIHMNNNKLMENIFWDLIIEQKKHFRNLVEYKISIFVV